MQMGAQGPGQEAAKERMVRRLGRRAHQRGQLRLAGLGSATGPCPAGT